MYINPRLEHEGTSSKVFNDSAISRKKELAMVIKTMPMMNLRYSGRL